MAEDSGIASTFRQVVPCLAASGGLLSFGMTVAFSSVAPSLHLPLQTSSIGSASHLAMIVGSLVIGPFLDVFGRRAGLSLALLLASLGWGVLGGGGWVVGGRLLTGLAAGLVSAPVSVLVAEISTPPLRAGLTTFKHSAFSLGLFLMYLLALLLKGDWESAALWSFGLSAFCLLLVQIWVPETTGADSLAGGYRPFWRAVVAEPRVRQPFLLMASLSALRQLSGTTVFLSYATGLLRTGGLADGEAGAVCLGAVRLAASLLAPLLADRLGRRALASYASYTASLALLVAARLPTALLTPLLLFVFTSALASAAIQALVGELFPRRFRAVSSGLTTTSSFGGAWVALHWEPWLEEQLGLPRLLALYASISVLASLLTLCFLPDRAPPHLEKEEESGDSEGEANTPLQLMPLDVNSDKVPDTARVPST